MKKIRFITAIALSTLLFLTPTYEIYADGSEECESIDLNNEGVDTEVFLVVESDSVENVAEGENTTASDAANENKDGEGFDPAVAGDTSGTSAGGNLNEGQQGSEGSNLGGELLSTTNGDISSYKGTVGNNLTLILRGLNENNQADAFRVINNYITGILENGGYVSLNSSDYVDAEKLSTEPEGYDSSHCWAATSANILWNTGYAQQAINPLTNDYFKSEDEVLTYFSQCFSDEAGAPDDGNEWFITGRYESTASNADLDIPESGGLLPNVDNFSQLSTLTSILTDPTKIGVLENIGSQGIGVQVRWITGNTLTENAHWLTAVGTIIDEAETDASQRYKAIVLADSDSDPVFNNSQATIDEILEATTIDERTAAKASQPNKYTVYRLTYDTSKGVGLWTIDSYMENETTVITYLYSLVERGKSSETTVVISEDTNEIFEIDMGSYKAPEDSGITMTSDYFYNLTSEQLAQPENQVQLYNYMITNNIPVFSPSKGIVSDKTDYEVYMTANQTFVYGVFVDNIQIPFDAYTIVSSQNGLSRIIIKKSYLSQLLKGQHMMKINIQGIEIPVEYVISVI